MSVTFPTNAELRRIGSEVAPRMQATRVGFQIAPERNVNSFLIEWEQEDNSGGLQQLRGAGGAPPRIKQVGYKRFMYEPGVYGEQSIIGEEYLLKGAGSITGDVNVDVTSEVLTRQRQLITRELDRKEHLIWTMLIQGTITVYGQGNQIQWSDTFPVQTFSCNDWDNLGAATPLLDFRLVRERGIGKGVSFGSNATAYMNSVTARKLLSNQNIADLGGKRIGGGNTLITLADLQQLFLADDLPRIQIYDDGYLNDAVTFTKFIPDDVVLVVGKRADGENVAEYHVARNILNPGMAPGSYEFVKQHLDEVPPNIEVHRGHNGGPVILYPSAVVVMSV